MIKHKHKESFYGTATIGEKGQVVVPADARKAMKLQKGDKLLVFSMGNDMVAFARLQQLEKMAHNLASRLETIRKAINKSK